jgi:hypothetical protein
VIDFGGYHAHASTFDKDDPDGRCGWAGTSLQFQWLNSVISRRSYAYIVDDDGTTCAPSRKPFLLFSYLRLPRRVTGSVAIAKYIHVLGKLRRTDDPRWCGGH